MSIDYELFLDRPARDFWHMIRYHAWRMYTTREYSKLMAEKK